MHDCPVCGQACDCDGEDTWLNAPIDCMHCPEGEIEDDSDNEPEREEYDLDENPFEWHEPSDWDEDDSSDDDDIYRTCEICGGEFWNGGTSCICPDNDPSIYGFCSDCGQPTPTCICQAARIWEIIDNPRTRRLHREWKQQRARERHQQMTHGKHVSQARRARKSRRA